MSREHTLSQGINRINLKELQQIIRMGLVRDNLIPAFASVWLAVVMANHSFLPSIPQILLMLLGPTLATGGACALNNYCDQGTDRIMLSKQNRPIVNNRITDQNLSLLSPGVMLVGEIYLFLSNIPSGVLGLMGIVDYVSYYSIWSKRHTTWNTVTGSFSGAISPLIGWVTIEGQASLTAIALFLVVLCWRPIHFYALAIKHKDEYAFANIPVLSSVKSFKRIRVSMFIWLIILLLVPLLLINLGVIFIVLTISLSLGWIALGLTTFKKGSD